jgi:hypothetical protein
LTGGRRAEVCGQLAVGAGADVVTYALGRLFGATVG